MSSLNLAKILELPIEERIRIVEAIWDSVAQHSDQIELLQWQAEELDRRMATYDANHSEEISWETVKSRILSSK